MANQKSRVNPIKRAAQNRRTFTNVQARRKKHAESHGMKVEQIYARRWVTPPK